jgi:hypothetical protein
MARSPRPTPSKTRAARKARGGNSGAAKTRRASQGASKKTASTKGGPPAKQRAQRTPATSRGRKGQPQNENWVAGISSLMTSQLGREILADVLDAAAGVLRQNRQIGQEVEVAGRAMIDTGADAASTAVQIGTEVASGAAQAGGEIAAAATEIAQAAPRV